MGSQSNYKVIYKSKHLNSKWLTSKVKLSYSCTSKLTSSHSDAPLLKCVVLQFSNLPDHIASHFSKVPCPHIQTIVFQPDLTSKQHYAQNTEGASYLLRLLQRTHIRANLRSYRISLFSTSLFGIEFLWLQQILPLTFHGVLRVTVSWQAACFCNGAQRD